MEGGLISNDPSECHASVDMDGGGRGFLVSAEPGLPEVR